MLLLIENNRKSQKVLLIILMNQIIENFKLVLVNVFQTTTLDVR